MKTTLLKILPACTAILLFTVLSVNNGVVMAQEEPAKDTTQAVKDNSSSFNDSVQFDDMEPIFYEATEEDAATAPAAEGGSSNLALYGGIIVALIVVLVLLKKAGKKKPAKQ